jgi:hypothetical protein
LASRVSGKSEYRMSQKCAKRIPHESKKIRKRQNNKKGLIENVHMDVHKIFLFNVIYNSDQIVRIFDHWVVVNSRQFLISTKVDHIYGATFFHGGGYICIDFPKKWIGLHFGPVFHKLVWSPWQ